MLAACLTLLGLIVGFSFSMPVSRYDLRQQAESALRCRSAQEFAESQKILRRHVNDAATARTIDVGDEKKCYCHDQWQHQEHTATFQVAGGNTDHQVAQDRDEPHEHPRFSRDTVPPGRLSVALRAQDVVHSGDGESGEMIRLYGGCSHGRPHLLLQAGGLLIERAKPISIPGAEELNSIGEVTAE